MFAVSVGAGSAGCAGSEVVLPDRAGDRSPAAGVSLIPPPHVRGPGEAWLAARGVDWVPAQRESVVAVLDAAFAGDRAVLDEYGVVFPVGAELTRQWVEAILVQLDVEMAVVAIII